MRMASAEAVDSAMNGVWGGLRPQHRKAVQFHVTHVTQELHVNSIVMVVKVW